MQIAEIADISNFPLTESEINLLTELMCDERDVYPAHINIRGMTIEITCRQKDVNKYHYGLIHKIVMLDGITYLRLLERRGIVCISSMQHGASLTVNKDKLKAFPQLDELRLQIALGTLTTTYHR